MRALDAHVGTLRDKSLTEIRGIVEIWQPSDLLPATLDGHRAVQEQARDLPDEVLLVLAGNTLTEKGLPTFTADIASTYGSQGGGHGSLAEPLPHLRKWFATWASEERRHEEVLGDWLKFSGRVDMRSFEQSTQLFLMDGTDLGIQRDPYKGIIYTSVQELATHRSHQGLLELARTHRSKILQAICGTVAADEAKHGQTYRRFAEFLFTKDPNGMMCAVRDMIRQGVVMPAHNMREIKDGDASDGIEPAGQMFADFSQLADRLGVYTGKDYAEIWGFLLQKWKIGKRENGQWSHLPFPGLDGEGEEAQRKIIRRQEAIEKFASITREPKPVTREWTWLKT
jgi:acyl-[acyl-carrier-protein] desaturase